MPRAYSTDLRERVLAACERGVATQAQAARRFGVSERTVSGWLRTAREEGRRGPKPPARGRTPAGGQAAVLAGLVAEQSDATLAEYAGRLAEYAGRLAERAGARRSLAAVCRALKTLGLVRKKRRSGPPSRIAPMSPPRGRHGAPIWRGSTPVGSSSSTRPASIPG